MLFTRTSTRITNLILTKLAATLQLFIFRQYIIYQYFLSQSDKREICSLSLKSIQEGHKKTKCGIGKSERRKIVPYRLNYLRMMSKKIRKHFKKFRKSKGNVIKYCFVFKQYFVDYILKILLGCSGTKLT